MSTVENGNNVQVHYVGTFDDGTEFDSSRSRGEPISFKVGAGQMIAGFEAAVIGMQEGDIKDISLSPDQAYGDHKQDHVKTYPVDVFPDEVQLSEGVTVAGQNELGQQMIAKVLSVSDDTVLLDFNHPMAGKNLNFNIEVVSVSQAHKGEKDE